jgi:hypothetical protein
MGALGIVYHVEVLFLMAKKALYPQFLLFGDSLLEFLGPLLDGFSLAAQLQSRKSSS